MRTLLLLAAGLAKASAALPPAYLSSPIKPTCFCNPSTSGATQVRFCPEVVKNCGLQTDVPSLANVMRLKRSLASATSLSGSCHYAHAISGRGFLVGSCDGHRRLRSTNSQKHRRLGDADVDATADNEWQAPSVPMAMEDGEEDYSDRPMAERSPGVEWTMATVGSIAGIVFGSAAATVSIIFAFDRARKEVLYRQVEMVPV